MTENSLASVPLPQQETIIPTDSSDNTKQSRISAEGDPPNKSLCTDPSSETHVTFTAQTDDGQSSASACPSHHVPCEQSELDESGPAGQTRSLASEVLEKARTRFDMFWGKSKPNPEDSNQ